MRSREGQLEERCEMLRETACADVNKQRAPFLCAGVVIII